MEETIWTDENDEYHKEFGRRAKKIFTVGEWRTVIYEPVVIDGKVMGLACQGVEPPIPPHTEGLQEMVYNDEERKEPEWDKWLEEHKIK